MELNKIFAYRVKQARKIAMFTKKQCKAKFESWNEFESGKTLPSSKELIEIAKFLNQKVDFFFRKPLIKKVKWN